jgi:small subunit ribosomal protein S12
MLFLSTPNQVRFNFRPKKKHHKKTPALLNCPQVRGTVVRLKILTPKKPNSARRPVAKVKLVSKRRLTAHVPGIGHTLKKHSTVLVRGGGARDLPGVNYTCCRGVFDLHGVLGKKRRRSIYGIPKPVSSKKPRRKYRRS